MKTAVAFLLGVAAGARLVDAAAARDVAAVRRAVTPEIEIRLEVDGKLLADCVLDDLRRRNRSAFRDR